MKRPYLAILDVGHGNCAVLTDSKGTVVIDTGPGSALLEYLSEKNIKTTDVILISHADQDHIGGLIQLLCADLFKVKCIRLNSDAEKKSEIWNDLLYELDQLGEDIDYEVSLTRNFSGKFNQGKVHVEILGPSKFLAGKGPGSIDYNGDKITTNSISAVIRLSKDKRRLVLLPGDIDMVGLNDLIRSEVNLISPVIIFPHHGGKAGSTDMSKFTGTLCKLVSPEIVVFSIGRGKHGTPRPEIVAAIKNSVKDVRIACTQLSEHCAKFFPSTAPPYLNNVFSQGHESRKCCAGTILVDLNDVDNVLPNFSDHQKFITEAAPTALCGR